MPQLTNRFLAFSSVFLALVQGCVGERTVIPPPPQPGLVVHAWPEPSFAQAAQTLQWLPNAVPGAVVVAERVGDVPGQRIPVDSVLTDTAGDARFSALPSARYAIRITRSLTSDERLRAVAVLQGTYGLEGFATA